MIIWIEERIKLVRQSRRFEKYNLRSSMVVKYSSWNLPFTNCCAKEDFPRNRSQTFVELTSYIYTPNYPHLPTAGNPSKAILRTRTILKVSGIEKRLFSFSGPKKSSSAPLYRRHYTNRKPFSPALNERSNRLNASFLQGEEKRRERGNAHAQKDTVRK